jgi:transmembrane sensor
MKRTNEHLESLARKWQNGEITDQEKIEFNQWYNSFDDTRLEDTSKESVIELKDRLYRAILQKENISVHKVKKLIPWTRITAAASLLIMLSIGGWFVLRNRQMPDVAAGGNKAILTLANGKQIILTTAKNGLLASQSNTNIQKTADGQLLYAANTTQAANNPMQYNTIATPRGGQYWVTLADGSKVLLNAASSLKYPVAFNGNERLVELTGEAYFEVVHNAAKPFRVKTAGQVVEDIGTHFNINAYADEPNTQTTLLEGSVKVSQDGTENTKILVPGEQLIAGDNLFKSRKINVDQAVAWKDGLFVFDHTNLRALMRQVSRWYDLEIVYEGDVKNEDYFGEVERKYSLNEVIKILKTGGLHFRIEAAAGGSKQAKLIVTP